MKNHPVFAQLNLFQRLFTQKVIMKEVEYDDIRMKTEPNMTRFGLTFGTFRFDETYFYTNLGFTPYWDYKPTIESHADSPGIYTSDKLLVLSTIDKFH